MHTYSKRYPILIFMVCFKGKNEIVMKNQVFFSQKKKEGRGCGMHCHLG
jgi:hypothetical protein